MESNCQKLTDSLPHTTTLANIFAYPKALMVSIFAVFEG